MNECVASLIFSLAIPTLVETNVSSSACDRSAHGSPCSRGIREVLPCPLSWARLCKVLAERHDGRASEVHRCTLLARRESRNSLVELLVECLRAHTRLHEASLGVWRKEMKLVRPEARAREIGKEGMPANTFWVSCRAKSTSIYTMQATVYCSVSSSTAFWYSFFDGKHMDGGRGV